MVSTKKCEAALVVPVEKSYGGIYIKVINQRLQISTYSISTISRTDLRTVNINSHESKIRAIYIVL